jgi:two-component system, NarL family, sensor histidine kinase UhpB
MSAAPRDEWVELPADRLSLRVMLVSIAILSGLFALYTSMQSSLVYGAGSEAVRGLPPMPGAELAVRLTINLAAAGVIVGLVALTRPDRRRGVALVLLVLGIAVTVGVLRAGLQATFGVYSLSTERSRNALLIEIVTSSGVAVITIVAALLQQRLWTRVRAAERVRLAAQQRDAELLRELQQEELRLRRDVSQTLHGSVQSVFVVLEYELGATADEIDPERAARIRAVRDALARLREGELRTLSATLYPVDLDHGVGTAVRALVARVPARVAIALDVDGGSDRLDRSDVDHASRVLAVRIVEEGIANALRHGRATAVAVTLTVDDRRVTVVVDHAGVAPAPDATWSGLARLRREVELGDGAIGLAEGGALGGGRLRAEFTAARPESVNPR